MSKCWQAESVSMDLWSLSRTLFFAQCINGVIGRLSSTLFRPLQPCGSMRLFLLGLLCLLSPVAVVSGKDLQLNLLAPPTEVEYGFCGEFTDDLDGLDLPLTTHPTTPLSMSTLISKKTALQTRFCDMLTDILCCRWQHSTLHF